MIGAGIKVVIDESQFGHPEIIVRPGRYRDRIRIGGAKEAEAEAPAEEAQPEDSKDSKKPVNQTKFVSQDIRWSSFTKGILSNVDLSTSEARWTLAGSIAAMSAISLISAPVATGIGAMLVGGGLVYGVSKTIYNGYQILNGDVALRNYEALGEGVGMTLLSGLFMKSSIAPLKNIGSKVGNFFAPLARTAEGFLMPIPATATAIKTDVIAIAGGVAMPANVMMMEVPTTGGLALPESVSIKNPTEADLKTIGDFADHNPSKRDACYNLLLQLAAENTHFFGRVMELMASKTYWTNSGLSTL